MADAVGVQPRPRRGSFSEPPARPILLIAPGSCHTLYATERFQLMLDVLLAGRVARIDRISLLAVLSLGDSQFVGLSAAYRPVASVGLFPALAAPAVLVGCLFGRGAG